MINSEPLPLMTQTIANQSSLYNNQYRNPTTKSTLTLEQQYQNLAQSMLPNQQQPQSNPYDDYINTLNSVSDVTKQKIMQDERFQIIYLQCIEMLNQSLYAKVLPEVLNDQNGRIAFERLYTTTKALKDELVQKDLQKEKTLDLLMQDEVVLRRLQELQNAPQTPQSQQPIQTPTRSIQTSQQAPQPPQNASTQPQQTSAQNTNNYVQKNQNKQNNQHQKPQSGGAE